MENTKNYRNDVLNVNANFKIALKSTGKAIKILIASEVLNPKQLAFLKELQKTVKNTDAQKVIDEKYKKFDASIRRTKSNQVTPFYVLQALYKAL
jgi:hypothetical protein